jgi:ABC-2 type transport system ATP-binding protein
LQIELKQSIDKIPEALEAFNLEASEDGSQLTYTYDPDVERTGITALLQTLNEVGVSLKDLKTSQSSLEEIFVRLVNAR